MKTVTTIMNFALNLARHILTSDLTANRQNAEAASQINI
jgi:hypothetical protein